MSASGPIWYNIGQSKGRFSHKAMKKASRALFLVAVALCAVVLGRMASKGLRSGLPDAYAGESRAPAMSAAREVAGGVTKVSDGDTIRVTDAQGAQHKIRLLDIDAPEAGQTFGAKSAARLNALVGGKDGFRGHGVVLPLQPQRAVRRRAGRGPCKEDRPLGEPECARPVGVPQGDQSAGWIGRRVRRARRADAACEHTGSGRILFKQPHRVQSGQGAGRVEDASPRVRQMAGDGLVAFHELDETAQQRLRELQENTRLSMQEERG